MSIKRERLDYRDKVDEVARLFRSEQEAWKKDQLLTVKLLFETEKTLQEVAYIVGRARSLIQVWANLFREGGITNLLIRGNSDGRTSRMNKTSKEAIIEKLKIGEFRTAKQFQKRLLDEYQFDT